MKGSVLKRCKCPVEYDSKGRRKACRKAHGSWVFVADMGIDQETGKRRQIRKSGFRTSDEAEDALAEFLTAAATGQATYDKKLTMAAYLGQWIASKEFEGLRPTTIRSYRQHIDQHLVPHLGRVRLGQLQATHIERALQDIAAKPEKGEALSAATVGRIHATLRSALGDALRKHLVSFNAAANVRPPRAVRPKVKPWEPAELGKFLDKAMEYRDGPLFETMAATGLRRGEACGLRWEDLDLAAGVIRVRQQLIELSADPVPCMFCDETHGRLRFGPPKTASGEHRVVDLDRHTIGVLMAHQIRQADERAEWGKAYRDHGLVFCLEDGSPLPPSRATETFTRISKAAGLRQIRLHDLRHGQASLMLAAGVDMAVVSKRLGHSTLAITSDTYSHLLEGIGAAAAQAAADLVPRDHSVTTPADALAGMDADNASTSRAGGAGGARTHDLTDYESAALTS